MTTRLRPRPSPCSIEHNHSLCMCTVPHYLLYRVQREKSPHLLFSCCCSISSSIDNRALAPCSTTSTSTKFSLVINPQPTHIHNIAHAQRDNTPQSSSIKTTLRVIHAPSHLTTAHHGRSRSMGPRSPRSPADTPPRRGRTPGWAGQARLESREERARGKVGGVLQCEYLLFSPFCRKRAVLLWWWRSGLPLRYPALRLKTRRRASRLGAPVAPAL